jgi:hypothetical protein
MATPMSARLSAGASFTPSPVTATTSPLACSAVTTRSFCAGVARAKITGPDDLRSSASSSRSSSSPLTIRTCSSGATNPTRRAMLSAVTP